MNVVLIIPDAQVEEANALGVAMGWGVGNYSVPLSASGLAPASHWGLNIEAPTDEFLAMLDGAAQGAAPEGLEFPPASFAAVLNNLAVWLYTPFNEAAAAAGLRRVPEGDQS